MSSRKQGSIKYRVVISFCLFAFFISALFSLYNLMLAYVIEDAFFERVVEDEARYLIASRPSAEFGEPRQPFMQVYRQHRELPPSIQRGLAANPQRREFIGENQKHYHLFLSENPAFFLVAEVSDYLVVRSKRSSILLALAVSTLLMLVFAGLCGYWLAIRTTGPLSQLAALVQHAQPETLPVKFAKHFPNNEIGILATSLEAAMARIKAFLQREQHFTRDVSHELRTPIAVIKGAAELLTAQPTLPGNAGELVQRIIQASLGMEHVVDTLLALARESKNEQHPSSVHLLPLVEHSVIQFAYLLEQKNVRVDVQVPASCQMAADSNALQIILDNLIRNAFQYTVEGVVSIGVSNNTLIISDTGTGIEKAIQQLAFEPLVKGKNSSGFGLGLSLVKRLCDAYRLPFSIESSASGTRARIQLD